jgi:flagellar basal body rod protein FlgG
MLRFSIRDLLWSTFVVALKLGWWIDHKRLAEPLPLAGKALDLAIYADGYFCLRNKKDDSPAYARYGHFVVNEYGYFMTVAGSSRWLLWPSICIPSDALSILIQSDGHFDI